MGLCPTAASPAMTPSSPHRAAAAWLATSERSSPATCYLYLLLGAREAGTAEGRGTQRQVPLVPLQPMRLVAALGLCAVALHSTFDSACAESRHRKTMREKKAQEAAQAAAPVQQGRADRAPNSGQETIRHLFATPLYHANFAEKIDMALLSTLALDAFTDMTGNASLVASIRKSQVETCVVGGTPRAGCVEHVGDDKQFTDNEKFFYWQSHGGEDGLRSCPLACKQQLDGTYGTGCSELQKLKTLITEHAFPRYIQAVGGMSGAGIPAFSLQIWAGVVFADTEHKAHEHFSDGNCLCSGVVYTQVPAGASAIQFEDSRRRMDKFERCPECKSGVPKSYFPGKGFQHEPQVGDVLLFPSWAPHEVKPARPLKRGMKPNMSPQAARIAWAFNVLTNKKGGKAGRATKDLHNHLVELPP